MALDYEKFKKIIAKIRSQRPTRAGKGGSTSIFTNNKEFQKIVKEITEAGVPIKEAAKKLGVAHSTISNARKELGLATRADVGGYSYLDDPKNIKYIKKNIGNKKLTTMGKELFPDVPEDISKVRVRLLREKHLPKSLRTGEFSAEAKAELSPEKAAERARDRARIRTAKLTKNSDVNVEKAITKLKKGYGVDLAHLQRKSLPQTTTNIGMDIPASNRGAMEVVEKIISDLENTNNKLYKVYKNKKIPKNIVDKIELNNQKIIDLVYKSNGAVVGNILDERTGKTKEFLGSYKYSADDGLFNLPMKEIAKDPQSLAEFKVVALNKAEQIAKLKGKTVEELFPDLLDDPDIKKRTDQILSEKKLVDNFAQKVKSVPGGCRAIITRALGGPLDSCEAIIKADPERAAVKLNNAITATKGPLKNLKDDSQKLIRLFRGESMFKPKDLGYTGDKIIPRSARGRWFSKSPEVAGMFAEYPGIIKKVDVTPTEFAKGKKIQTRSKLGSYVDPNELVLPKSKMADVGIDIPRTIGYNLKWDNIKGAFVNTKTDNIASQAELKTWAVDNPMPVQAGTSVKPGLLRKTGRALAHIGLPLPTAAMDAYFIGRQIEEGRDATEIAKDPFNWLGLATMEPLTKAAGVADKSCKLASVMRLGMSPGMIRGATRFLGLPGLAISTGLTAYDQYKKYQDKEGFIYDLFNKVDNTDV